MTGNLFLKIQTDRPHLSHASWQCDGSDKTVLLSTMRRRLPLPVCKGELLPFRVEGRGHNETARVHHTPHRCGLLAPGGARAADAVINVRLETDPLGQSQLKAFLQGLEKLG